MRASLSCPIENSEKISMSCAKNGLGMEVFSFVLQKAAQRSILVSIIQHFLMGES